ncbi:MAG: hypothetical protein ACD_65C00118G0006, partial [uncultured bacterium]
RIKRTDIGHPEICNVFALQKIFNLPKIKEIERKCREGKLGCVENKKFLCETIFTELKNAREKRIELRKNLDYIDKVLNTGAKKARKVATETLDRVKRHTGL